MDDHVKILLQSHMRVIRKQLSLHSLQETFFAVEKTASHDDFAPTEEERRVILDFPQAEQEDQTRHGVTLLARSALFEKAAIHAEALSEAEAQHLYDNLWSNTTSQELKLAAAPSTELMNLSYESLQSAFDRIEALKNRLYLEHEKDGITNARIEVLSRRRRESRRLADERTGGAARIQSARPWIRQLDASKDAHGPVNFRFWGFVVFVDADLKHLDDELRSDLMARMDSILDRVLLNSGSKAVHVRWKLQYIDMSDLPPTISPDGTVDVKVVRKFAEAFSDLTSKSRKQPPPLHGKHDDQGGLLPGILANTFLVLNRRFLSSTLPTYADDPHDTMGHFAPVDDMALLAVEHPATLQDNVPFDEYPGYMWVRVHQICNRFYEVRWLCADTLPMSELWQIAKRSSNHVFVGSDEREAGPYSAAHYPVSAIE